MKSGFWKNAINYNHTFRVKYKKPEVNIMGERILTNEYIEKFVSYLQNEEKSCNTQEKYIRDVHAFF